MEALYTFSMERAREVKKAVGDTQRRVVTHTTSILDAFPQRHGAAAVRVGHSICGHIGDCGLVFCIPIQGAGCHSRTEFDKAVDKPVKEEVRTGPHFKLSSRKGTPSCLHMGYRATPMV
jgi:hypothetical protein